MLNRISTRVFLGLVSAAATVAPVLAVPTDFIDIPRTAIPEPAPVAIMMVGLAVAAFIGRAKKRS